MRNMEIAEINKRFDECLTDFKLLCDENTTILAGHKSKLNSELTEYNSEGILKMILVGEYNAGKSTLARALTGDENIKISSNITTNEISKPIPWHGIHILDAPGIGTENKEHDEITLKALHSSDLILFCITPSLFSKGILSYFNKIVFAEALAWKTIIVLNKLSDESGDIAIRIDSYKESMAKSILPEDITSIPCFFVDAKDYIDGIHSQDEELIEISRFETLVNGLDSFIQDRGILARIGTPIHKLQEILDEASNSLMKEDNTQDDYMRLLNKCSRVVKGLRNEFICKSNSLIYALHSKIYNEGESLVRLLHEKKNDNTSENQSNKANENINKYVVETSKDFESLANESIKNLEEEMKKILNSQLGLQFIAYIENQFKYSKQSDISQGKWNIPEGLTEKIKGIASIMQKAGVSLAEKFGKVGAHKEVREILIKTAEKIGKKIPPRVATKIAKKITDLLGRYGGKIAKIAKWLGPIGSLLEVFYGIKDEINEATAENELFELKNQIRSDFKNIAEQYSISFNTIVADNDSEIFESCNKIIQEQRTLYEKQLGEKNVALIRISEIREKISNIISEIEKEFV